MNSRSFTFLLVGCAAVFAQNAPRLEFEVATIRPAAPQPEATVKVGVRIDGAQYRAASLTLRDYLASAYRLKRYQISGPDWTGSDRFDIAATLPAGGMPAQVPEMLRSLLNERFQLKTHRDTKELPVYTLEIAKGGLKAQESAPDPNLPKADASTPVNVAGGGSGQGVSVDLGRGASYTFANDKFTATRLTMAQVAGTLERFLDRPIVDQTGIAGTYDFTLDVTAEDYRTMLIRAGVSAGVALPPEALRLLDGSSPTSLFDALQKLGLTLTAKKAPLEILVIDDARKTPTDN